MPPPTIPSATHRRDEGLLFLLVFVAFGWFHQGGGWNQNGRFALVRAIVENHTFFIDSHLVYLLNGGGAADTRFTRPAIHRGQLTVSGEKFALGWGNQQGRLVPISGTADSGSTVVDVSQAAVSGDIAYHDGHFHPNKAPGTSFAAVPAYWVIFHVERALGLNADEWRTLTVNAWLTSVFSVGLIAALGVVLLYRFALLLSGDRRAALLAALTLAFGTMFLSYATMLFEHDIIAVALLAAWYLGFRARDVAVPARGLFLSGLCAGYAAITNYIVVVPVVFLGIYVIEVTGRHWRSWRWYAAGLVPPFLLICAYNVACFGTPFTTNYRYQNPMFVSGTGGGRLLGVLGVPSPSVLAAILLSPYRGLFVTSPVLIMGIVGLVWMYRSGRFRLDAMLCTAMLAFFVLFNASFNGWDGGWSAYARYLCPMLPFLALPLVFAYQRALRLTSVFAGISVVASLCVVAVDPQPPTVPWGAPWSYSPVTEYVLPILIHGRPAPLLDDWVQRLTTARDVRLQRAGVPADARSAQVEQYRQDLVQRFQRGNPEPLAVAAVTGPVSANPIGVYEAGYFERFGAGSAQAKWNSFNVGELLFPESVLSVLLLLVFCGGLAVALLRDHRIDAPRSSPSEREV